MIIKRPIKLQMNTTTFKGLTNKRYSITIPRKIIKGLKWKKRTKLLVKRFNKTIVIQKENN